MDKIIIKDAKFSCNVGVSDKERSKKQTILIDIDLFYNIKKAARSDYINDTINYSDVYKKVKGLIENKKYKLIETIAEEIAALILKEFNVKSVRILVKKPSAIKEAKFAAVEIARTK